MIGKHGIAWGARETGATTPANASHKPMTDASNSIPTTGQESGGSDDEQLPGPKADTLPDPDKVRTAPSESSDETMAIWSELSVSGATSKIHTPHIDARVSVPEYNDDEQSVSGDPTVRVLADSVQEVVTVKLCLHPNTSVEASAELRLSPSAAATAADELYIAAGSDKRSRMYASQIEVSRICARVSEYSGVNVGKDGGTFQAYTPASADKTSVTWFVNTVSDLRRTGATVQVSRGEGTVLSEELFAAAKWCK